MSKISIVCQSGETGWRCRLQENYRNFAEFEAYCEIFKLHTRLKYDTPYEAWTKNPMIEGSTNTRDFRRYVP